MEQKELIESFKKSSVGKVLAGKEAFRNQMGRVLHGFAHKHPNLAMAVGITALIAGGAMGTVPLLAATPVMFAGVYAGISPKKDEKAACEFLANVAVRKTFALSKFIDRQKDVPMAVKESTIRQYLTQNLPMGMLKEYMADHPDAIQHIMSGNVSEACYHDPNVYKLEAVQEQFTKNGDKGGILHGMIQPFTKKYRDQVAEAEKIADDRWQDRQIWEKLSYNRPSWISFMHSQQFERTTGKSSLMGVLSKTKRPNETIKNMDSKVFGQQQKNVPSKQSSVRIIPSGHEYT